MKGEGATVANMVQLFNSSLRGSAPELTDMRPISDEEMRGTITSEEVQVYNFWEKPRSKALFTKLVQLRLAAGPEQPGRNPVRRRELTLEERREPAWETEVRDYLKELEAWERDHGESPVNFFHQVCLIYVPLIELIPPGPLRNCVLASFIGFLRASPLERDNPPEWLVELRRLLQLSAATPGDVGTHEQNLRSGSPTMALYVELERLVPERR